MFFSDSYIATDLSVEKGCDLLFSLNYSNYSFFFIYDFEWAKKISIECVCYSTRYTHEINRRIKEMKSLVDKMGYLWWWWDGI